MAIVNFDGWTIDDINETIYQKLYTASMQVLCLISDFKSIKHVEMYLKKVQGDGNPMHYESVESSKYSSQFMDEQFIMRFNRSNFFYESKSEKTVYINFMHLLVLSALISVENGKCVLNEHLPILSAESIYMGILSMYPDRESRIELIKKLNDYRDNYKPIEED